MLLITVGSSTIQTLPTLFLQPTYTYASESQVGSWSLISISVEARFEARGWLVSSSSDISAIIDEAIVVLHK